MESAFSPDGQTLTSTDFDYIRLWNTAGTQLAKWESGHLGPEALVFSPDGQVLVSGGTDESIKIGSINKRLLDTLKRHRSAIVSMIFTPDGKVLITSSSDGIGLSWKVTP